MRLQATSICINGRAYLITGKSGSGKSSLALALINLGATLISDDVTEVIEGVAKASKRHKGWLEVRQLGLVSGFSVADGVPVAAVIELVSTEPDRLSERKVTQLGDSYVPLFHLWAQDTHLADKVFVIDALMAGQLNLE